MPRRNKKKSKKQIQNNNNKNSQHQAQQRARQSATETALLISDHETMQTRCQKTLQETVQRVQPHGEEIMDKSQPFPFVVDMGDGSEIVAQCGRNIEENIMSADRYRRGGLELLPLGVHNGFCDELLQLTIHSLGIAGSTNKTTVKLTDGEYHYWFMAVVGVMSDCVHFVVRIYRDAINPEGVVAEESGSGQTGGSALRSQPNPYQQMASQQQVVREAQAAKPNLEEGRRVVEQNNQSNAVVLDPNPDNWGVKEVAHWVKSLDEDMDDVASKFKENRVRGGTLLELEKDDLVEMGITKLGDRKFLLKRIAQLHAAPHEVAPPPAAFSQPVAQPIARPAVQPIPVAGAPPAPPAPLAQQMNLMQQHLEYPPPDADLSVSSSSGSPSPPPIRSGPTIPPFRSSPPRVSRPNMSPVNKEAPRNLFPTNAQAEGSPPGIGNERKHGEGEGDFPIPAMVEPDEVPQRKQKKAPQAKPQPGPPPQLKQPPQSQPQPRPMPPRPAMEAKKPKAVASEPSVNRPPTQKPMPPREPNIYVLYVTNLADNVRPEDLNELFGSNVKFRVHFSSKKHDAFLEFHERPPAEHALRKDGTNFHGKPLRVVKSSEKKLIELKLYQPPKVKPPVQPPVHPAPKPAPRQSPPKRNQPKRTRASYMESPPQIAADPRSPKEPSGPAVFRQSRPVAERQRREYSPGSDDRRSHRSGDSRYRPDSYDPYSHSSRNVSPRVAEGRRTDDMMKDKLRRLAQPRQEGEANPGPGYAEEPVRRRRKRVPPPRDIPPDHAYDVNDDYSSSRTYGRDDQSERSDRSSRSHYSSSRRRHDDYDDRYDQRYEDRYEPTRYDDASRTDGKPHSRRSSQHDSGVPW